MDHCDIVGIGASAGGIPALRDLVSKIPDTSGLAYAVVLHLSQDQPSHLDELLRSWSDLPVKRAEHGDAPVPDTIYVCPEGYRVEVDHGTFRLDACVGPNRQRNTIDLFFSSLAKSFGRNACGVVLSGAGSDGTNGIREIKAADGVVFVQNNATARFSSMPESAFATGLVDFALPPEEIPAKILEIRENRDAVEARMGVALALQDGIHGRLPEVLSFLSEPSGRAFSGYKPGTLVRRIARRMALLRAETVEAYLERLSTDPDEAGALERDFMIGVTRFFRDSQSFDLMAHKALEALFARDRPGFRVWVPGCSTGEEVYSLAMLITEKAEARGDRRPWKIFGTDIDMAGLRTAREGIYSEAELSALDPTRRARYLSGQDGPQRMATQLREMCAFAPHNLLLDPPFSNLDMISCRNVLIYLDAASQDELTARFHYALAPAGYLWLGMSEALDRNADYFELIDRTARLYRRNDTAEARVGLLSGLRSAGRLRPVSLVDGKTDRMESRAPPTLEQKVEGAFLRGHAGPFAALDRTGGVVYVSEAMAGLVQPRAGAVHTSIEEFLTPPLRMPVREALGRHLARGVSEQDAGDTVLRDVLVPGAEDTTVWDIRVSDMAGDRGLMLLSLSAVRPRIVEDVPPATAPAADGAKSAARSGAQPDRATEVELLRRQLQALKRDRETAEQELRAANEELLSMNEELQSFNDELESNREELQSVNEELETINAELREANARLLTANSDLQNLLESTSVPTLFLNSQSQVRRYTPNMTRLFSLQARDLGRSIHDLTMHLDYPSLRGDIEQVQSSFTPKTREVTLPEDARVLEARITPYVSVDSKVDGVVISFVDITERKSTEMRLAEHAVRLAAQNAELSAIYDQAPLGLGLVDTEHHFVRVNDALARMNGVPASDHLGKTVAQIIPLASDRVTPLIARVLETGEPIVGEKILIETPMAPGELRHFIADYFPVALNSAPFGVAVFVREVTAEVELRNKLEAREIQMRQFFDGMPTAVAAFEGPQHALIYCNEAFRMAFAGVSDPADGASQAPAASLREALDEVYRGEWPELLEEIRWSTPQPASPGGMAEGIRWWSRSIRPWQDGSGRTAGVIVIAPDITDLVNSRTEAQQAIVHLRTILDGLFTFVGMLTPDGTLVEVNRTALVDSGLTREQVIGKKFWDCWWWSYSPEGQKRLREAVDEACAGRTVRYDAQVRLGDGRFISIDFQIKPNVDHEGRVIELIPSAVDITDRVRAAQRKDMLVGELEHRVKNTLATIEAIVAFSLETAVSPEEMTESVSRRIAAIARTHDSLTDSGWQHQYLRALFEDQLRPYADTAGERVRYEGVDVLLSPREAMSLGLGLHELATNAAKHGALSRADGSVALKVKGDDQGFREIVWEETGGPTVTPPARRGFGTFLIEETVTLDLGAEVAMDYPAGGLRCTIRRLPERRLPKTLASAAGGQRRILLVEDEPLIGLYVKTQLTSHGYSVDGPHTTVQDAKAAIAHARPDIAILDVNLGNGETSEEVVRVLDGLGVPYGLATGYGSATLRRRTDGGPVPPHLVKPIKRDALLELVRTLMREVTDEH